MPSGPKIPFVRGWLNEWEADDATQREARNGRELPRVSDATNEWRSDAEMALHCGGCAFDAARDERIGAV
jgi:hypothetical protein